MGYLSAFLSPLIGPKYSLDRRREMVDATIVFLEFLEVLAGSLTPALIALRFESFDQRFAPKSIFTRWFYLRHGTLHAGFPLVSIAKNGSKCIVRMLLRYDPNGGEALSLGPEAKFSNQNHRIRYAGLPGETQYGQADQRSRLV